MNKTELQIIAFVNFSVTFLCAVNDRCKGLNKTMILSGIKRLDLLKYETVYKPENFIAILNELKRNHKEDIKNYKINDYINTFIAYMKNTNENNWVKLLNMYNEFKGDFEGLEEKLIKVNEKSVKVIVAFLTSIVNEITGRETIALSFQEYKKLLEKNKTKAERYIIKYNELMRMYVNALRGIFKKSDSILLSLTAINSALSKLNFPKMFNQDSEDIMFDVALNIYAKNGKRLSGRLDPYKIEIEINSKYDSKNDSNYVLTFKAIGAQVKQFMYSMDYKRKMNTNKYEKVWDIMKNVEKYRSKWLKFIESTEFRLKSCAIACEIIYQTTMRVGTVGNKSKGEDTYGLLTLEKQHITLKGSNEINFKFIGKGGAEFKYNMKNTKVFNYLNSVLKNKKNNENVFSINGEVLNKFITDNLQMQITIHKFRTLKATQYAYENLIEKFPFKKVDEVSQKDKLKYLQDVLMSIGEMLQHHSGDKVTTSTALKNYIDPGVIKKYYELCKIPLPKQIQQLMEYENPDPDALPEIPKTWPGNIQYPTWAYYKTQYY